MDQHVTRRTEGADETRVFRVVAQFLAQRGNVDVDAAIKNLVIPLANFFQQLVARFYPTDRARA